ncbi:MAG: hypothetical protein HY342_09965 [Candidatus Lambdaproteobacteria bacterium]|nr:hypothetical protein [Candidatus Lambdaproteobacteria bacterium]
MKMKWLWIAAVLVLLAGPAFGETVHLKTGEVIKGKITAADEESISIQSDQGFGVIQVRKAEIVLVEYDDKARDLTRKMGFGYYHRSQPNTLAGQLAEFGVDALSLKYWLSDHDSLDFQLGFFNSTQGSTKLLEIFSLELRYAQVFQRRGNVDLYYGGSAGYISVVDSSSASTFDATGTSLRGFLGVELFFASLPDLGLAMELGLGTQSVGKRTTTNLSSSGFPSFAVRYYY